MWLHLFIIFAVRLASVYDYNYCHKVEMCPMENAPHFLCNLGDELKPYRGAEFLASFPNTKELQREFLEKHNEYRNLLAEGAIKANGKLYNSASRMRELIWDTELAYTARMHANYVCFQHSKCRSTARFPHAGENLSFQVHSTKMSLKSIVNISIGSMFDEYKLCQDPADLIATCDTSKYEGTGHFTVIVNDHVSRLGCGIAIANRCAKDNPEAMCFFITCHYDFTNMFGSRIYKEGASASECSDWNTVKSSKYENLCEPNEEIFKFEP